MRRMFGKDRTRSSRDKVYYSLLQTKTDRQTDMLITILGCLTEAEYYNQQTTATL